MGTLSNYNSRFNVTGIDSLSPLFIWSSVAYIALPIRKWQTKKRTVILIITTTIWIDYDQWILNFD